MSQTEIWKPIPSSKGWMASSLGRIKCDLQNVRMPNGGIKKLIVPATFGTFCPTDRRFRQSVFNKSRPVAQLICEAFHGPRPDHNFHCMHLDEDSTNNVPSNLAWGTKKENMRAPKYIEGRRAFMRALWAKRKIAQACQDI